MTFKSSFIVAALCAATAVTATPATSKFVNQANAHDIQELSFEQWQQVENAMAKVQQEFDSKTNPSIMNDLFEEASRKVDNAAHKVTDTYRPIVEEAEEGYEQAKHNIEELYGSAFDSVLDISREILGNVEAVAEEAFEAIEHAAENAEEAIQDWSHSAQETYDQMAHIGGNIISDAWKATQALRVEVAENVDGWEKTVRMAAFPDYQIRFKQPKICDADVKQISGYLDVGESKHFFFWFFEARENPKDAPVVLWLNGGPGCSSMTGLFMELGPCSVNKDGSEDTYNKYSWTRKTNMIFLDQPTNVGFSYGDGVSNTVAAGKDVYALLNLFFSQYNQYADNDFHIAGESYGGHYVPQFALEIHQHNTGKSQAFIADASENAVKKINLKTILIGNGLTDPLNQYDGYAEMACNSDYDPVLTDAQCDEMRAAMPRCKSLIESCYSSDSVFSCVPASIYCNRVTIQPYQETGKNVYDVRDDCEDKENLCYPILGKVQNYLNLPHVQKELGVKVKEYKSCNMQININFQFAGDWMKGIFVEAVKDLIEDGIEALIYSGSADYICNWIGNENWTRQLVWSGQDKFVNSEFKNWTVIDDGSIKGKKGKEVLTGNSRSSGEGLTFLKVNDASHMAPYSQPHATLEMYERWLFKGYSKAF